MCQLECDFTMRVLRVRFSVKRFAVYNAEAVFALFTMENGISKIILPKEP